MSDKNPVIRKQLFTQTYHIPFAATGPTSSIYISVPFRVGRIITKQLQVEINTTQPDEYLTLRSSLIQNQSHGITSVNAASGFFGGELEYRSLNPQEINGSYYFTYYYSGGLVIGIDPAVFIITLEFQEI